MDLCSPKGLVFLVGLALSFIAGPLELRAQRRVDLDSVRVSAKQPGLQTLPLYNNWEEEGEPHIGNFYALGVYHDGLGSEIWFTPS
ncbi:MAG: hypothetical protein ACKODJ_05155, partial [Bacteroidota bacterium]